MRVHCSAHEMCDSHTYSAGSRLSDGSVAAARQHVSAGSIPVSRTTFYLHKQVTNHRFAPHMHHNVDAGQDSAQYQ